MQAVFYGTREPVPVREPGFIEFGGNTTCVGITFNFRRISVFDAGTGIRKLGIELIEHGHEQFDEIVMALSHTHWDHIQGFPFFKPAYDPRRNSSMAICGVDGAGGKLKRVFEAQMQSEFFPVPLENIGVTFRFQHLDLTDYTHPSGVKVSATRTPILAAPTGTAFPRREKRWSIVRTQSMGIP